MPIKENDRSFVRADGGKGKATQNSFSDPPIYLVFVSHINPWHSNFYREKVFELGVHSIAQKG
jgi:hypothetical protein